MPTPAATPSWSRCARSWRRTSRFTTSPSSSSASDPANPRRRMREALGPRAAPPASHRSALEVREVGAALDLAHQVARFAQLALLALAFRQRRRLVQQRDAAFRLAHLAVGGGELDARADGV